MNRGSNDNFSLYIPRIALSSSGSSSKSSSRSKEFAQTINRINGEISAASGESESEGIYGSSIQNYDGTQSNRQQMYLVHKAPKRGSHSTQSSSLSSGSDHSNYSVNSLLLSVKNLENFNKSPQADRQMEPQYNANVSMQRPDNYINYFLSPGANKFPIYEHRWKMLQNIRSISVKYDKNLESTTGINKEKEIDEQSTTSSTTTTNFTVISLNDSDQRLNKSKAICRRSHQITILIFIMTVLFLIGISFMLIMLDMRNQKMPS